MGQWKKAALAACAAGAMVAPATGMAQGAGEQGFYVGGSVGEAKAKDFCDTGGIAGLVVTTCNDKDTAMKVFAGYQFMRHLAVEASYMKLGDLSADITFAGLPGSVAGDGSAFSLAVLGLLPLSEQFSLFGKIGMAKTEVDASGSIGGISVSASDDETELHYGIGVLFNFTRNWGVRAEWEKLEDSKVDMISIGVQYRF